MALLLSKLVLVHKTKILLMARFRICESIFSDIFEVISSDNNYINGKDFFYRKLKSPLKIWGENLIGLNS